jgi:hypothetical protein
MASLNQWWISCWAIGLGLVSPVTADEKKVEPAPTKQALVCELTGLPEKAEPGSSHIVTVTVKNFGKNAVPLLKRHVEYVTSLGTGVGVDIKPCSKEPAKEEPAITTKPDPVKMQFNPKADNLFFGQEPTDILAIAKVDSIEPGKALTFKVKITMPKQPGEYEVRSFIRSWMYYGPRNGIAAVDPKDAAKMFVNKTSSEKRIVAVK